MTRQIVTKTMDGNTAAAYVSYPFTDVAAIFPITPSSPMAELIDEWSAAGRKNLFGQTVKVVEMQSEGGVSGTLHGSLQAGALTTTYTASQGLLLMIPNMYNIAGRLLPAVFHVAARSLSANIVSMFGDHEDVMATRQTGFALLCSSDVQCVMDLGAVAHLAAIKSRIPFLHFFDGFRTSHEIQKIELLQDDELRSMIDWDAVQAFRDRALSPDHPSARGISTSQDIFFQTREAVNRYYEQVPDIVEAYMAKINELTGRNYHLFNYFGAPDADTVLVSMGSSCNVIRETMEHLNKKGRKIGLVEVHLYRPFSVTHFLQAVPDTAERVIVLDRTKEAGASAEPLLLDVRSALYGRLHTPSVIGGRYGIGSKDFTPNQVMAIILNAEQEQPKDRFTVGIDDDVTHTSLPVFTEPLDTAPEGTICCKFWGLGADGTVGANKNAIKIIGDHTDQYVQAYFSYDSKKSGGVTISHLRFGKKPIMSSYFITRSDFIACHNQAYVKKYDVLEGLKSHGVFLLNCQWSPQELAGQLPAAMKRYISVHDIQFYTIDALDIARRIGLGGRINMVMQAAFFKLSQILPLDEAMQYLKEAVVHSYGKKGQDVVDMNCQALEAGMKELVRINVPADWAEAREASIPEADAEPDFIKAIAKPITSLKGDDLPVSAFAADGTYPTGFSKYEKRGIAVDVPDWNAQQCVQCNLCSISCAHAVIRPVLVAEEAEAIAPAGFSAKPALGYPGRQFAIVVSPLDCTGCGVCIDVCPKDALSMKPLAAVRKEKEAIWEFALNHADNTAAETSPLNARTSQFRKPYLEFSGACPGCGETPYVKLVTQLFGDRMMIANPAGCSAVWGATAPYVGYAKNKQGQGPAFGYSLFEDNAEFGFGMYIAVKQLRERVKEKAFRILQDGKGGSAAAALQEWLDHAEEKAGTRKRAAALETALQAVSLPADELTELYKLKDFFVKRSQWIIGGDGWAYDIGYGGLDHVLASGEDVNVLVFDTEVYSNTGGQSSKATPLGAVAKFAAAGKRTKKKDLGVMAMSYGNVYVAQIALGADRNQAVKAIAEAEAYHGPSLIIAYAPCINHGIKGGMKKSQAQIGRAVACGYWSMFRYNPDLRATGQNPFTLDSKAPTADFREFLKSEVRYASLERKDKEMAADFYDKAEQAARERLAVYTRLAQG